MSSQYHLEWASGGTPLSVPTPRPAVTRYLWPSMESSTGGTPRFHEPPRAATPLKREPYWQYPPYVRQSSEPYSHFRSHTPPPTVYQQPVAPVFGYRALNLPNRAVTPPPERTWGPTTTAGATGGGGGAARGTPTGISLQDFSPFMILRIKALLELCSVPPNMPHEDPAVLNCRVAPPAQSLRSCLRKKKTQELLEAQRDSEEIDSRVLLNCLLEKGRIQGVRPDPLQLLCKVNEDFAATYFSGSDPSPTDRSPKLEFSPGATLVCFDSGDKPRKIRDNHAKHYAQFLLQQRLQHNGGGGGEEPSSVTSLPTTPKYEHHPPVPRSLTPPLSRIVSENA
eukprot:Protomagalhaensia_sp_Gyna_25__278@NODE_1131_length_2155_cov_171_913043_g898_i0_p1_GENE_NODE_1131_length_2155_cov_171_913043_g898_i0NODE_1131_length_2155_cov_171_913043_g898_i0_p1_ORF_typecomplete_len338_score31_62_NODE_1131_length_2155_cov_171_913043_g898_i011042117